MALVVLADFEWDERKAAINLVRHGVSFAEAVTALSDPMALTAPDLLEADRFVTIGISALSRTLFAVHTEASGHGRVRLISARKASPAQREAYEKG